MSVSMVLVCCERVLTHNLSVSDTACLFHQKYVNLLGIIY